MGTALAERGATMSRTTGLILVCGFAVSVVVAACADPTGGPQPGDTSFISAPPGGGGAKGAGGVDESGPPTGANPGADHTGTTAGAGGVAVGGTGTTTTVQGPSVIVSSVSFGGGQIKAVGHLE